MKRGKNMIKINSWVVVGTFVARNMTVERYRIAKMCRKRISWRRSRVFCRFNLAWYL